MMKEDTIEEDIKIEPDETDREEDDLEQDESHEFCIDP
jgi:hypothetical protein